MRSLNSFADHVSGLPAVAVQTLAHAFCSTLPQLRVRQVTSKPTKFFISYPSTLSASRSYPNSSFSPRVNNFQDPLGLQFTNIGVSNLDGGKWVDYFNNIRFQNKFWFNPDQKDAHTQRYAKRELDSDLKSAFCDHETIYGEEGQQNKRASRPKVITPRPKRFSHIPSIAGDRK